MHTKLSLRCCRDGIERSIERGPPTLELVAEALGTSTRTLQRRLQESGVRFSDLRDTVRRERACRLLGNSDAAIADVAAKLGFADPSSFSRSFRRWTGEAPRAYRRRCADG